MGQSEASLSREKTLFISVVWGWIDAEMFSPHVRSHTWLPCLRAWRGDKVSFDMRCPSNAGGPHGLKAGRKEESKGPKTLEGFRSWTVVFITHILPANVIRHRVLWRFPKGAYSTHDTSCYVAAHRAS